MKTSYSFVSRPSPSLNLLAALGDAVEIDSWKSLHIFVNWEMPREWYLDNPARQAPP
jgi:hypothetical protein